MSYTQFLLAVQGVTIVAALLIIARWRGLLPQTGRQAAVFGTLWVVLSSIEFWGLGPRSFVVSGAELEYGLPLHQYMAQFPSTQLFSHGFAGGNDVFGMAVVTGQYVSLERLLIAFLPLWLAAFVHKVSAFAVAFWGAYLLGQRGFGAEHRLAAALAALFVFSHPYIGHTTWAHGVGYALAPLAAYVCVIRMGKPFYWTAVIAVAALNAVSSSPTHSGLALFPAVLFCAFLFGTARILHTILALGVFATAVLVNFHEAFYGMLTVAPWTFRGASVVTSAKVGAWPDMFRLLEFDFRELALLTLSLIGISLVRDRRLLGRSAVVLVLAMGTGVALVNVPWDVLGLAPLRAFSFHNIDYAFSTVAIGVIACLARGKTGTAGPQGRHVVLAAVAMAFAIGKFSVYKAANTANWLSQGGLGIVSDAQADLAVASPRPADPVRVVTMPYRLHANMAVANGLESLDGNLNLLLRSVAVFWQQAVLRHPLDMSSGFLTVESRALDLKCCDSYNLADHVDLDMLRLTNVGFVLSKLPLTGPGLIQIAGPADPVVPPRTGDPLARRLIQYWHMVWREPPVLIYRLDGALPRVYAALKIEKSNSAADHEVVKQIRQCGLDGCAILSDTEGFTAAAMRVTSFQVVGDRVEVSVDAPSGGTLLANIPFTPFWSVRTDGREIPLQPANLVQMAVAVPPGASDVVLEYRRPLLLDRVRAVGGR